MHTVQYTYNCGLRAADDTLYINEMSRGIFTDLTAEIFCSAKIRLSIWKFTNRTGFAHDEPAFLYIIKLFKTMIGYMLTIPFLSTF